MTERQYCDNCHSVNHSTEDCLFPDASSNRVWCDNCRGRGQFGIGGNISTCGKCGGSGMVFAGVIPNRAACACANPDRCVWQGPEAGEPPAGCRYATRNHVRNSYEPCVLDSEGNCTRWSHDHSAERIEQVLREWVIPGPSENEDVDEWITRLVAAIIEVTRS